MSDWGCFKIHRFPSSNWRSFGWVPHENLQFHSYWTHLYTCRLILTGWPVILLSKKDTSLGLFPYFLILLSFFGLKLVLNILLWLQNYEIWSFLIILGPKNSILRTKNTKKVKYCLLKFCWEEFVKNQCQMMPATL